MRLLLVDDEPDICDTVTQLLEVSFPHVEVVVALNGLEALDRLRRGGIDAVITDYRMPGLNGAQLVLQIRASWPRIPTLMITAYLDAKTLADLHSQVPGLDVMPKPIEVDAFLRHVTALLAPRSNAK